MTSFEEIKKKIEEIIGEDEKFVTAETEGQYKFLEKHCINSSIGQRNLLRQELRKKVLKFFNQLKSKR